jgi:hypothetical protein
LTRGFARKKTRNAARKGRFALAVMQAVNTAVPGTSTIAYW